MKRKLIPALILFSLIASFCCKTIRPASQQEELVSTDEISDYLRSSNVYMRNSNTVYGISNVRVSGDSVFGKPVLKKQKQNSKSEIQLYTEKNLNSSDTNVQGELVLTKKEIRKATVKTLLDQLHKPGDDEKPTGIAIGLAILIFLLAILILVGLIYLLAVGLSNATNSSSGGSNSGTSNSGGSNSGGSGSSSSGCYVATMVYGDYDAPEVMVLRKFRDETLSRSAAGRAFIRWYYSWSPGFVKKYNHLNWLHRSIRFVLDRFVKMLS